MGNELNVKEYDASLKEPALLFHSGNNYLDNFLRSEYALDEKYHGILQAKTDEGEIINLSDVLLMDCIDRMNGNRNDFVGFTFITLNST